jgi:hypothetical protein
LIVAEVRGLVELWRASPHRHRRLSNVT